jgi:cellulose synthase/poly-beta-1,6-N-acetylglucosamine synthase-like glycosyltransferase
MRRILLSHDLPNERLLLGLAPEVLGELISQRSRWCLGAIQQLFTLWLFMGSARLTWINRIAFFDTSTLLGVRYLL